MTRALLVGSLLLISIYAAHALGLGREGLGFGRLGVMGQKGTGGGGGATNFILMVDGSSRILQTDNASKICKAGGC